jgi:hypothetical protein
LSWYDLLPFFLSYSFRISTTYQYPLPFLLFFRSHTFNYSNFNVDHTDLIPLKLLCSMSYQWLVRPHRKLLSWFLYGTSSFWCRHYWDLSLLSVCVFMLFIGMFQRGPRLFLL